ncbi:MAG: glycosyltransferase family 4 protein [Rivularia sp. ALOHA_DT_140]|nr:glycosyltransferase family 4 protein [Rivularia sp. ALOHA_DT_140]
MKIAYCGLPHTGGTYTVYRLLREGMLEEGIDLRWVGLAPHGYKLSDEFKQEANFGEFVQSTPASVSQSAQNFIKHIEANYQGIIINVLANPIQTNAARYISNKITKLQIVHNITPATYRAATAIHDYVHATVCPTPRIANDLVHKMNLSSDKVFTIPHAVDLSTFKQLSSRCYKHQPLKLIYLGRIEENAKGILWLPEIVGECQKNGINVLLTVVGDGQDLSKLKFKTSEMGLEQNIHFYGRVSYTEVPRLFSEHHVFVMPSRYEGFGYTLVEAMASGCVPVCSRISGVTDFIVSHGKDGFLFDVGNTKETATFIRQLANENIWQDLSDNAKLTSQSRFGLEQQAKSYGDLIKDLNQNPPKIAPPLPLDNWKLPPGLKPRFVTYLPDSVKNILRVWRERLVPVK